MLLLLEKHGIIASHIIECRTEISLYHCCIVLTACLLLLVYCIGSVPRSHNAVILDGQARAGQDRSRLLACSYSLRENSERVEYRDEVAEIFLVDFPLFVSCLFVSFFLSLLTQ